MESISKADAGTLASLAYTHNGNINKKIAFRLMVFFFDT